MREGIDRSGGQEPSVAISIVEEIKQELVRGRYRPGSRLPTERELAQQLRISRSTIREAMRMLAVLGVVEARGRAGTHIASDASAVLREPFAFLMALEHPSPESLLEARETVEVRLAGWAAERRTEAELIGIQAAIGAGRESGYLAAAPAPPPRGTYGDFHCAVARAAHNPALSSYLITLYEWQRRQIPATAPVRIEDWPRLADSLATHQRICDAIRDRDADAARRLMTIDMQYARDFWAFMHAPQALENASDGDTAEPEESHRAP
ncbi:MAG: FadR family transcriptional regulator [Cytophagales bacterium]|nr:FadR family transcriptional regulator [Armatimonadota bacterium]